MATEVTIPQLGESVTEGTITAWLKEVGDHVDADEPLFELSSDKIDTEVPAPAGGVLKEIKVEVDETVDVGTVVAIIADEDEADDDEAEPAADDEQAEAGQEAEADDGEADDSEAEDAEAEAPAEDAEAEDDREEEPSEPAAQGDGEGQLTSPIVRRLASEHDLDLSQISGSGKGGRITREDVEAAIEGGEGKAPKKEAAKAPSRPAGQRGAPSGERKRSEDLSRIRQRIAAKMMESMQSSAQLTTVQEADVTPIMNLRAQFKDEFKAREGVSLSPFAFLCRAAVLAIRNHPTVNAYADWEAGKVTYHDYVNLGIAVDTEKGLIVPNVKGADDLSLAGLARAINEAAAKARGDAKLEMQDIEGGTFTVTNTGSRGVLLDTPILNYPEVGILATGAIQKRPVVIEDASGPAIAVREMVYLCLTYDHRLLDGADAARFVTEVKRIIEEYDWAGELGLGD